MFACLTYGAFALACVLALLPAAGHDQMWLLYVTDRVLHGTRLYGPEMLESNPPLIVWLLCPVEIAARFLHLQFTFVFKFCVVVLEALVALWSARLLRYMREPLGTSCFWPLLFGFICVFGVLPARDFGQRDHLLALMLLPYLVTEATAAESFPATPSIPRWVRIAAGIVAGIGVSLKPHHLLVPVAIEGMLLLRLALRRDGDRGSRVGEASVGTLLLPAELVALFATCAAYVGAIRIFTPAYLTAVLPLLRATYWAIGPLSVPQLIAQSGQLHVLAGAAILMLFVGGRRTGSWLVIILLVGGAASTAAYYLQGTGWYYQQLPAISFFSLALWLELLAFAGNRQWKVAAWAPVPAATLAVAAVSLAAHFSGYSLLHPLDFPSGLTDVPAPNFFQGLPAGTPIAILTTAVDDSIPPVYTHHLLLAQRQNVLWTLPAILRNESPGPSGTPLRRIPPQQLKDLDERQHRWMDEDLAHWKPRLILIERCQDPSVACQVLEDRHDNLLAWFERDPNFRAEFAHYRYWRSGQRFDGYVRVD
jgi:hypothetical protein